MGEAWTVVVPDDEIEFLNALAQELAHNAPGDANTTGVHAYSRRAGTAPALVYFTPKASEIFRALIAQRGGRPCSEPRDDLGGTGCLVKLF